MGKRCIISAVVMFVMALVLSFFVHGVLLYPRLCRDARHAAAGRGAEALMRLA